MDNQKIALTEQIPYSGKPPWQPRQGGSIEEDQRLKAIKLIKDNSNLIKAASRKYNVSPESIAGAILWEAVENPYPAWRYSPVGVPASRRLPGVAGKIHADQWYYAYGNQKIPRTSDYLPTIQNLNKPKVAIEYIAALMDIHATNYENIAGVNIRRSPGVLATLYHGGDSYGRAIKLRDARYQDRQSGRSPRLPSVPPKEMGEYVEKYQEYLRNELLNLNELGVNDLSLNKSQEPYPVTTQSGRSNHSQNTDKFPVVASNTGTSEGYQELNRKNATSGGALNVRIQVFRKNLITFADMAFQLF